MGEAGQSASQSGTGSSVTTPENAGNVTSGKSEETTGSATSNTTNETTDTAATGKTNEAAGGATSGTTSETAGGATSGITNEAADGATSGKTGEAADEATSGKTDGKQDGDPAEKTMIAEVKALAETVASQTVAFGTAQENLHLPQELAAVDENGGEWTLAVQWSADPSYEAEPEELKVKEAVGADEADEEAAQSGETSAAAQSEKKFVFSASLTDEAAAQYALADGVALPQITVTMTAQEAQIEKPMTGSQEREFTASADGVTVKVYAKRNALPENAALSLSMLGETDVLAQVLKNGGKSFAGMVAMELGFAADGQNVEPTEPVRVVMEIAADAVQGTENLMLYHFSGTDANAAVETVAAADGSVDGTVNRSETSVTAEFTTDSFSPFALTWGVEAVKLAAPRATSNLYIYTLIPGVQEGSSEDPNKVWNGMGIGRISGVRRPNDYGNKHILFAGNEEIQNKAQITYPDSFPAITIDGVKYQYAAQASENATKQGYYTVSWLRVIVSDGANAGDNGGIKETVAAGTLTFHLDGVITPNMENQYVVQFAVKDAGGSEFILADPETYSKTVKDGFEANKLKRPEVNDPTTYPATKVKDGITYAVDGWYKDKECTQKVDWNTEVIHSNTTYYAHYIPQTTTLTVEKQVTGGLGDRQKDFNFEYSYVGADKQEVSGTAVLKDDGTFEIRDIPVGAEVTITETNKKGYTTTAVYSAGEGVEVTGTEATAEQATIKVTVNSNTGAQKLTVTNNKDVTPDTGITLDSLPYLLMLAAVLAAAAVFVLVRVRRRKENR